ncbi:MAG: enoyl-CoA hydratase [Gammaproteobacteria bacterium]|jgi:enoyl-CoA hydratase/carnithine racemase|nr:enoyl-CoA hydratase [Gammaproteobacteria bacterium]
MTTDHLDAQSLVLMERSEQGVLRLTLNNPASRNALSEAMLVSLHAAITEASSDPQVRVIVLAAKGPVFCAGHDLKELTAGRNAADNGRGYFTKMMHLCSTVMQSIVNTPKPVIAEVSGVATAAGCQLVASCDLAWADKVAQFSTPGVNIGLFCSTPMVALSRNLSNKHAMEMLLTGTMISAQRAAEVGLINGVVDSAELTTTTMAMAQQIAAKSSKTLAIGKRAFYEQQPMPLADAYAFASAVMVDNMLIEDAQEGIGAFIDKRIPTWSDQ